MTLWVDVARIAIVLNLFLLALLLKVWAGNYLQFRSKHTMGLLVFAAFLSLENAFALYFYFIHEVLRVWVTAIPTIAQLAMTLLRVLEFAGLAVLTYVTWD